MRFEQRTIALLMRPAFMSPIISVAAAPGPGISDAGMPHTWATASRSCGSSMWRYPGSCVAFWPISRPPCPLPCPVIIIVPPPGFPTCPRASARLMHARQLFTPCVECSMPRACITREGSDRPYMRAAARIRSAGTPQSRSAYSGVNGSMVFRTSSQPTVRART
jgi:hypothetical protein